MINFSDTLVILNDDAPCEMLRKKYAQLLIPTISVLNFKKKKIYKKYNNIFLYSYKDYSFFLELDNSILYKIQRCLNKSGILKLIIYINKNRKSEIRDSIKDKDGNVLKKLKKECLYNGFINIEGETTPAQNGVIINVRVHAHIYIDVTAENPDFLLKEDESDLSSRDEETYENKEDNKKVVNRVCDNCTCGRKKNDVNLEKISISGNEVEYVTENVVSSCGNCYLGDAFRCASCPYKGLPAFQPGENVKLNLNVRCNQN
ncbi:hypothetical protein POVWA2_010570 [Plasmodium ovale wallikeri]|uniref:Anamorsin homolog n=1 Tax=Plasmodium ovale wallikeri TaxID=864142 RepID=A0A1A8YKM9_PLAOA|nr:hypothetical protein POVWA1_010430 [Plasmodium ovale wallikeri]SBT32629.1 hypothetical protein POVWA2_010570 [Plasmodium ovale wallikeri]